MTAAEIAVLIRALADASLAHAEAQARVMRALADHVETSGVAAASASVQQREPRLDKQELARHLGVSVGKIDKLDNEGQPYLRVGEVKRYLVSEVEAWHRERSTVSDASPPAPKSAPRAQEPEGVRLLSRSAAKAVKK